MLQDSHIQDLRLSVIIEFNADSNHETKLELMHDLDDAISAIMDAGQNTFSGDGECYNFVDGYTTSWDDAAETFRLDISFANGTSHKIVEDLKWDLDNSVDAIMDAGQNTFSGDGKFYSSVDGFYIQFD